MVGTLSLSPAFDPNTLAYTASTTNATNKVTAAPVSQKARITILNGDAPVQNGGTATWTDGENVLKVTVENGTTRRVYTVTVSKSAEAG